MGRKIGRRVIGAGAGIFALAGIGWLLFRKEPPPSPWRHASLEILSYPGCYATAVSPDGKSIGLSCHQADAIILREGKPVRPLKGDGRVFVKYVTNEGDIYGTIRKAKSVAVRWTPEGKLILPKVKGDRSAGWGPLADDGTAIVNFADRGSPWIVARDGTAQPFTLDGKIFEGVVTDANADLSQGVSRDRKTPFPTYTRWREGRGLSRRTPGAVDPRPVARSRDGTAEFFFAPEGAEAFRNGVRVGSIPNPPLPVMPLRDQAEEEWKRRTATTIYRARFRPSASVEIRGVSEDGRVAHGVRVTRYDGPESVPFVYREGAGFWPLRQILAESGHSLAGWDSIQVSTMSLDGTILAGSVRTGTKSQPFVVRLR